MPHQNNLISKFTRMVSATESTIDQTRQPGMKRTCARSPDRFQITNIAHRLLSRQAANPAIGGSDRCARHRAWLQLPWVLSCLAMIPAWAVQGDLRSLSPLCSQTGWRLLRVTAKRCCLAFHRLPSLREIETRHLRIGRRQVLLDQQRRADARQSAVQGELREEVAPESAIANGLEEHQPDDVREIGQPYGAGNQEAGSAAA